MPLQADFPWWMIFVFFGMFMAVKGTMRGGRRPERLGGRTRDEIKTLEETVANRDAVIDDLQHRMSELESRLDFTERLLAEKPETVRREL
jgi:hypothetical protein